MKYKLLFLLFLIHSDGTKAQQAFEVYNAANSSLPDNTVRCITIDAQKRKWIGTDYGLAVYNDTTWSVYQTINSNIADNAIRSIAFDSNNNAWIGTQNGGVSFFNGISFVNYNSGNSNISSDFVRGIGIDNNNIKWICTDNGLNRFNDTTFTIFSISNSALLVNNIACITFEPDSNHIKWIGTVNGGLVRMIDTSITVYSSFTTGYPDNTNLKIGIDSLGFKWVATPAAGLVRFFNDIATSFNSFNSPNPSNSIYDLAIDSLQRIYMACYDSGLVRKDGLNYISYNTTNSGMPENILNAVAIEREGVIWAGTFSQGLVRIDEGILALSYAQNELNNTLIAYPNPANKWVTLSSNQFFNNKKTLQITNVYGENVNTQFVIFKGGFTEIDLSQLMPGIYFLKISGIPRSSKVIKF